MKKLYNSVDEKLSDILYNKIYNDIRDIRGFTTPITYTQMVRFIQKENQTIHEERKRLTVSTHNQLFDLELNLWRLC